jgi:RND family efflux transporter MFP subunit
MEAVRNGAYRRELLEVRSGLAASRADASRIELDLEKTIVGAPFSGVITGLELNANERVQAGQVVARLIDDINIEAEVAVLESDLAGLEVGRAARVTIPALGETLDLEVDVISPEIDEESRTCKILLRLDSDGGRIKPGMFARAAIAGQIHHDRLLVPREAILTRDGRPLLFKIEDGRAHWVYVKLGERNDHLVEIERIEQGGPLEPGTLVVVDNHLTLTHEAKIKVKKQVAPADPWMADSEQG